MIQLNIRVTVDLDKEEELRAALRRTVMAFVFKQAESIGIDHREVAIDGDIKIELS